MVLNKVFSMALLILLLFFSAIAISVADERKKGFKIPKNIKPTGERLLRGKAIYGYYCSPCHGVKGDGNGPNAENLSRQPRNFTDRPYMNIKSDRDLYQVVNGGGNAVGLSFLMPPWGNTLSEMGHSDVIVYIRTFEKSE